jgi:sporulation related protein
VKASLFLCLAVVACGGADSRSVPPTDTSTVAVASSFHGPDPLVLRIPKDGGPARVVAWPNIDSTIWTSADNSPAPGRVLGFDDDAGIIAMVDGRSRATRIDLRAGGIIADTLRTALTAPVSIDGSTIFGVNAKGAVVRITPSGTQIFQPSQPARGVFPLRDGTALIWSGREGHSVLSRLTPTSGAIKDSLTMPAADFATGTGVGDRLYFAAGDQLHSVQTKTLKLSEPIPIGGPITDIAVTPSGDRIFVLTTIGGEPNLVAVDRYRWRIASTVPLHGKPRELRVDPIGRYVLVRGARDSLAVIGVANNEVVGGLRSDWRADLPLVAPDGSIATALAGDVIFLRAEDGRQISRVKNGASEFWFAFWWTGFRPRAIALDQPVTFDSAASARDTSTTPPPTLMTDSLPPPPPAPKDTTPPKPAGFTVSFFTLLSESKANTEAAKIQVEGETAHVETVLHNGVPVYRVILGPYRTCADAQRIAKQSGKTVWIPEGGCDVPPETNEPLAH